MSGATLFHFVLGAVLLIPGAWLVTRGRLVLGWVLTVLGTAIGLMGVVVPLVHGHLHH